MTERIKNSERRRELPGEKIPNIGREIDEYKEERKKNGKEIPLSEGETTPGGARTKIEAIANVEDGGARGRRVVDLILVDQILSIVVFVGRRIGLLH